MRRGWFRSGSARGKGRPRRRWFPPPACGDDPIAWKERYFAPVDRFTRMVLLPAIVVITLPLALITEVEGRLSYFGVDLWRMGLAARQFLRDELLWALQVDLGWYVGFWLLAVAGAAASAVTVEREKDTWISLTTTPLTGGEILRGKVLGAIWNQRGFAAVLASLWMLGLFTGAAHLLGVLASITVVGLLTWMVAMVGIYASLRASNTSRALASTLVALATLNGYPILVYLWYIGKVDWGSSYLALGAMPTMSAWSMVSPRSVANVSAVVQSAGRASFDDWLSVGSFMLLLLAYATLALTLTWRVVRLFDRWLDRPPLTKGDTSPPAPTLVLEEAAVG